MSKIQRQKNISMDEDLLNQLEALCSVLHTNFTNKTKELLVNWKIEELKRLKDIAPELHDAYQQELLKAPVRDSMKSTHKKASNTPKKP